MTTEVKNGKNRAQRPTFRDLVKLTGYSQGAISRAFNGQPGIGEATREKILKAAREIGYYPNPAARNFKRGYTSRIGIVLPNLGNTNYSELYEQLDLVNAKGGYSSILAITHDSETVEADTLLHWSAGETDGLIINPIVSGKNVDLYRKLKSWGFPIVLLYRLFGSEFDGVYIDYKACLRQALIYLQDVGHRKVAYVGFSNLRKPVGKLWLLLELLKELEMEFDETGSVFDIAGDEAGIRAFSQWNLQGRRPTAVVTYSDQTAISLYSDAVSMGLEIPRDISIFGSDDVAGAKAVGLSTIRVDRSLMARVIVDILHARMRDFDAPTRIQTLPCELVLRRSMGPVPKSKK
ncbi:LacI family DNA-binding transcriptional regulator [Cerasicoccus arenae]|uniref:LacI family transcriptional regulator n=1 Tax=Cerasicoccus arenae TaxID=424488 RepID=A0A8J3GDM6_9BACT|nr:LacI family DNA-binding transcriptional regulator [Cerasicoccus arenae]MBK1859233.1 LacI family DNA-binding transcriptional regulator [Cerasicoccus arenae]GHC02755.1 LacI family transcriptional regulator [Cerasicoccus arenae]